MAVRVHELGLPWLEVETLAFVLLAWIDPRFLSASGKWCLGPVDTSLQQLFRYLGVPLPRLVTMAHPEHAAIRAGLHRSIPGRVGPGSAGLGRDASLGVLAARD